jgi:enamine deaminase RidA (YjgF/YER057c/UK114 family)
MSVYQTLQALGITIPAGTAPVAAFAPFVRTGNLVVVSGHIAKKEGRPWVGQLGGSVTTEEGQAAARGTAIDIIGTLQTGLGDLNLVSQIVKVMVLVNSVPTFTEQHLVANGASQLLIDVFATKGVHARSAFGVAQVPFGSCLEIELIAEVAAR